MTGCKPIILELSSVASYLLSRGLVSEAAIVDSHLTITESPHRNANYKVISEYGPSYLVKQGVGVERAATVEREAAVYGYLGSAPGGEAVRRYLPRCLFYDPEAHILVVELVTDADDLDRHYQRVGRFSVGLARKLGRALGSLHRMPASDWKERARGKGAALLPLNVLTLHRPRLDRYTALSGANLHLLRIIQQFPEFGQLLDQRRRDWREECFLHGDAKRGNILAVPSGKNGRAGLKIVDWELAGMGDPCWDAGSVFSDYLSFWLMSVPITGKDPPGRFLDLARYPLAKMQPAIRAFWDSYTRTMGLDPQTAEEWLNRAARYCAARLVQTAFDESQIASEPTANAVCLLQLSLNILQRPRQAAVQLLGIR
ncbi:MAG TPA: aminoglycoside phosphotransferase family protein [Chloroflexia bacterium]|nr:aminoglycoside phosphotransferase family protein [Chloroflexia bacterium]